MSTIECKLICPTQSGHLQQLLTGFVRLHNRRIIDLTRSIVRECFIDPSKAQHLRDARRAHLQVIVNETITIYYDAHDSWEIDEENLTRADFYFKRSFAPARLETLRLGGRLAKIHPLGLNYSVYPSPWDAFAVRRSIESSNGVKNQIALLRALGLWNDQEFVPRITHMESLPDFDASPRILFMAQAWDPYDHADRCREKVDERMRINEMRAGCIARLRDEFPQLFFGGFIHTEFAAKHFRGLLIPDRHFGSKQNYLELLKSYPICVATTGLHGSIGWKFGEYVAFSKAIVSERLNYQAPGDFRTGSNYLDFATVEECVEKIHRLVDDRQLMGRLMTNNRDYYLSYLHHDALVRRTIDTALQHS